MTITSRPFSAYMTSPQKVLEEKLLRRTKSVLRRAVFLDRDGTINVERGYITNPDEVTFYPNTARVFNALHSKGYVIVIISNQSAIGRGLMTMEQLDKVNDILWGKLRQSNAWYDALYFCPHTPEQSCDCRKPKPGLILQAALDLNINLSASYFIGDKITDIEAGHRSGCKTILVLTGKGTESLEIIKTDASCIKPNTVETSLSGALAWIQKHNVLIG